MFDKVWQAGFDDWTLRVIQYGYFISIHIDTGDIPLPWAPLSICLRFSSL